MGRRKTPLTTLKATGAYRRDRHGDRQEPKFRPGSPTMPRSLTDPEAQKLWRKLAKPLFAAGVATIEDTTALQALCDWFAIYRREIAAARKAKDSLELADHVKTAVLAWRQTSDLLKRFGLTPVDRANIKAPLSDGRDSIELRYFESDAQ